MKNKELMIKPVYSNSVIAFSLVWACIPFGYVINIISLIISLIYFKRTLNRTDNEDNLYYLKKNHTVYQYSFLVGTILGIIITLFMFEVILIRNIALIKGLLHGLCVITVLILFLSIIIHRDMRKEHSGNLILILNVLIAIILVILLFFFFIIPNMIYVERAKSILQSCSGNLRNLGIIITNYSTDHKGHYPQNLEELETLGYIEKLPGCYETGEPYIYIVDGWDSEDFTVMCPNPEVHVGSSGPQSRTASLYYSSGKGVNQIDMDDEKAKIIVEKQMKIQREKDKKKRILIVSIVSSSVFIGGLVYLLILIPDYIQEKKMRKKCIHNLINLGIVVTLYSVEHHAQYPENLNLLVEEGLINEFPICPITGEQYQYSLDEEENVFTISCPNPEKHIGSKGFFSRLKKLCYKAVTGIHKEDKER